MNKNSNFNNYKSLEEFTQKQEYISGSLVLNDLKYLAKDKITKEYVVGKFKNLTPGKICVEEDFLLIFKNKEDAIKELNS